MSSTKSTRPSASRKHSPKLRRPRRTADMSDTRKRSEPLAAAVNWEGLATFLGRPIDQVRTVELIRRTAAQLEAAESAWIEKALRYMNPSDISADFTTVAERRAIAAVFKWLSLNGVCAWQLKGGTYSTTAMGKGIGRLCRPSHAIVLETSAYEAAREILGL